MHFATLELAFMLMEHIKEPLMGYKVLMRYTYFIQVILLVDQRQRGFEHQIKDSCFELENYDRSQACSQLAFLGYS
jgi:hypothetical protein